MTGIVTGNQDSTPEDAAEAVERLEQALDRLAALASRTPAPADATRAFDATKIADRLDAVIAKLRAGLGPDAT